MRLEYRAKIEQTEILFAATVAPHAADPHNKKKPANIAKIKKELLKPFTKWLDRDSPAKKDKKAAAARGLQGALGKMNARR